MADSARLQDAAACIECGADLGDALACPRCRRLVHGDRLRELAAKADVAARAGSVSDALSAWRDALDLLPPDSRQATQINAKIRELSRALDAPAAPAPPPPKGAGGRIAGIASAVGVALWKLKLVLVFMLTKAKLLLLGLTKLSTLFSMALTLALYARMFGVAYGIGIVLSIYVHEIGHVSELRRYGIAATAPMFVPGLGAFVRLRQYPSEPREDARVGLAGPRWGLVAALGAYAVGIFAHLPVMIAIARTGAWINLFNLVPVWQLDGSRGFRAIARRDRWMVVAAIAIAWMLSSENLLILLLAGAGFRAMQNDAPEKSDRRALVEYIALTAVLALICAQGPTGAHGPPIPR